MPFYSAERPLCSRTSALVSDCLTGAYSEVGEFIDFTTFDIFRERFVASGRDVGGLILGGLRVPFGDRFAVGGEVRYQRASGTVGLDQGFLNERIDLGGIATQFTFQIGF